MPDGWRQGRISTPLGVMIAVVNAHDALLRLDFEDDGNRCRLVHALEALPHDDGAIGHVAEQLKEYFAGSRQRFELPLAPQGSAFLQRAWRQLRRVPFATTASYGEIARLLQPASSARAVGRANAMNPISIIIPCHRVLAAGGRLVGYSAGLQRKAALLAFEADVRKQARAIHESEG
jgi:methylated-DNA-[protein]-cysteine S-methyltransferase